METKESNDTVSCSMLTLLRYWFSVKNTKEKTVKNTKEKTVKNTKEKINQNKHTVTSYIIQQKHEERHECPICQDSFTKDDMVSSNDKACIHKICWKCYGMAYKAGRPIDKCPVCRRAFNKKQRTPAPIQPTLAPTPAPIQPTPAPRAVQSPRRRRRPIDYIDRDGNFIPEFMTLTDSQRNSILQELSQITQMARNINNNIIANEEEALLRTNLDITPVEMRQIVAERQRLIREQGRWM